MRLEIKVYRGRPVTATVLPEMSAVKHAFQFIAVMGPNQEHVAPKDLAVTVTEAFPNCKVDWEAGDEYTRENVAKLESMGIPEMMLEGARSFMGNRFVLTVKPVSEVPGELSGVVSTVHRDLGDSLGFTMNPYVPQHFHTLAEALAAAIDFRYHLSYDESFSVHVNPSPCTDPLEIAKRHLPIPLGDDPDIQVHRLSDWESTFHVALQQWLELSHHKNKFNDATRSFGTLADYAAAAKRPGDTALFGTKFGIPQQTDSIRKSPAAKVQCPRVVPLSPRVLDANQAS